MTMNPTQQRTLANIRVPPEERGTFPVSLADDLHSQLAGELEPIAEQLRAQGEDLWISKRSLSAVGACEASYMAEQQTPFEYNPATARGSVIHRGVEFWANPVNEHDQASDYIGHAISHYIEQDQQSGNRLGEFLAAMSTGAASAFASECTSLLQNFQDTFPPIGRGWELGVEVPRRHPLCEGTIVLSGKFDLTLGKAGDTAGDLVTPGRVIIDLKTGNRNLNDAQDMRFYALLETLQTGVPPMLVGTFYVTEGAVVTERVDMEVLRIAVLRTVDGARRLAELTLGEGEKPHRRPGFQCLWCSISDDCEPGQVWLAERED